MQKLTTDDLMSLETYARERAAYREKVMAHKKPRRVPVGPNFNLYFEDRLTMQYQVQEMLRVERIFEPEGIAEELETYNPLIPDGSNLKATEMFEFPDKAERQRRLGQLGGVEHLVWLQVEGQEKIRVIANEDLERSTDEKTSAVHFMRFEFDDASIDALKNGAGMSVGIDHDLYRHAADFPAESVQALTRDFS